MIEYLETLVNNHEYQKVLNYAEQLMLASQTTARDLLVINYSLLKARTELSEYQGAVVSGELVTKLAQDLGEWDYYGNACFLLGPVYMRMRQPQNAIGMCYNYLSNIEKYGGAAQLHALVLFNLGIFYSGIGDHKEAVRTLEKAVSLAESVDNGRTAHGIRHGLILVCIKARQLDQVVPLLARCAKYLRYHPEVDQVRESWLWHYLLRAEFAIASNRLARAVSIARHGLRRGADFPYEQFHYHMILARVSQLNGVTTEAFGHALAARICAIQCRRYNLEFEASEFLYGLTVNDPRALERFNEAQPIQGPALYSYGITQVHY